MAEFGAGAALFLGCLLVLAGALKVASPLAFRHAVYRLLPEQWARRHRIAFVSARLAGSTEVIVGAGLISAPWLGHRFLVVASVVASVVFVSFLGVVAYARRRGLSCGCFVSFSDGSTGLAELGRAVLLAALALALVVVVVAGDSSRSLSWHLSIGAWALASAALTVLWVVAASHSFGTRDRNERIRTVASAIALRALGRIENDLGDNELPIERRLSLLKTRALVATTLTSPSYLAFAAWLGPRASCIDWAATVAVSTTMTDRDGGPMTVIELDPRTPEAIKLSVLLDVEGVPRGEALVFANVDGRAVVASDGVVRPAIEDIGYPEEPTRSLSALPG